MPGLSPVLLHFRWQLHSIGKHGGGGKPQLDLKPINTKKPYGRHCWRLSVSHERPRARRAAEQRDELAPLHCEPPPVLSIARTADLMIFS